jgi:fermentation-respiration switch protein FrsA (DUF1100 family)
MRTTMAPPISVRRERTRFNWRRLLAVLVVAVPALVIVAYFGISTYVANQLSSPPRRAITTDPGQYGLAYEEVTFSSTVDNVSLNGWFIDAPGTAAIVMVHGRAAARDDGPAVPVAAALVGRGYDVLLFDLRAQGTSGGDRYTMGQKEVRDVAGAVRYLKEVRGASTIGGYGTSMGASTLINAAPDLPELKVLVADNGFADLSMLLEKELPKVSGLPSFFNPGITLAAQVFFDTDLAGNRPIEHIAALNERPIFFIHTENDPTIPVAHSYMLRDAAAGNTNMEHWVAPGEGHTMAYSNHKEEYVRRVLAYYDQHMK